VIYIIMQGTWTRIVTGVLILIMLTMVMNFTQFQDEVRNRSHAITRSLQSAFFNRDVDEATSVQSALQTSEEIVFHPPEMLPDNPSLHTSIPFVIVAGTGETDGVDEAIVLLNSILLLSSMDIDLYIITDKRGVSEFTKMFEQISSTRVQINVSLIEHDPVWTANLSYSINVNPYRHHSGAWGMTKLWLPLHPALKSLDFAIIVDTDMVFLVDPAELYDERPDRYIHRMINPDPTLANWAYMMPLVPPGQEKAPKNICSCVVLTNLNYIRKAGLVPQAFSSALSARPEWKQIVKVSNSIQQKRRLYNVPNGDQGIYFALWEQNPDLIRPLDWKWNRDKCHKYNRALDTPDASTPHIPVNMIHRNCFGSNIRKRWRADPGDPYFTFFYRFKWLWHDYSWHKPGNKGFNPYASNRYKKPVIKVVPWVG